LLALLRPLSTGMMEAFAASTVVNDAWVDAPGCLEAIGGIL